MRYVFLGDDPEGGDGVLLSTSRVEVHKEASYSYGPDYAERSYDYEFHVSSPTVEHGSAVWGNYPLDLWLLVPTGFSKQTTDVTLKDIDDEGTWIFESSSRSRTDYARPVDEIHDRRDDGDPFSALPFVLGSRPDE